ncbi:Transforming acidic coiled-coil-containing protein 3 [Chytriomyces hyalinus]|nr:Transforming acidic coiled-coil-containing protein 3 [Chytriomyces hyalinus]
MDTQSIASTINNTVADSLGVPASIRAESPSSTFSSSRLLPAVAPSAEKHHHTSDRESFPSSPSKPTQTSAASSPLLERQSLSPSIVHNTGTPLIRHEVLDTQQMSKSPSTATLDTLAADAFVGMADVSTDLLASDISLNPHERSSVMSSVETKITNVLDAENARQESVQETYSTAENADKYSTAGEEKVLSPPSRPSSKRSPIPNRSNSATLGLPNGFYLPSGRTNPLSVRRASEGTVLSNEAPLLHGFSGTASTASTLNSGRIGHLMQQPPPLQQYPAKYAPIISPHQQKELLTRFNSPVNSLHTRASTPTLATAGRYHSGRGAGSVGATPRAVSGVFNETNSRDFGGLDETMQSQPPLLLQQQRPQNILPPPTTSMYELHSVFSTPSSQPKYSERDISAIRMEITLKFEREFEMAQLEIQDLERQRNQALEGTRKIQKTLKEWETFMKEMIAKKEADDLRSRQETAQLCFALEQSNAERDASAKAVEEINARMRQLRLDAEIERDTSKKALLKMQQESNECVSLMEDRYQVLKAHAEEKLQEANIEIARVRGGLEKEIASLRVKISRSELHVASLEKNVESKAAENAELTKICDDLLMQPNMFPPRRSSLLQALSPTASTSPSEATLSNGPSNTRYAPMRTGSMYSMESMDGMESMEGVEETTLIHANRTFVGFLPPHLVQLIFKYVGFDGTVMCARGVCVQWNELYTMGTLWNSLSLPRDAVLLRYIPHGCVATMHLSAPSSSQKVSAINSCRLLASHGQRNIQDMTLEGHGIDSSDKGIMQYLARIVTPHLRSVAFQHVGLSFERTQFLSVMRQAPNISSLRITRRKFRRATVLQPLLSIWSISLTHLRLDNIVVQHIPDIGALVPNLQILHLDGPFELMLWANDPASTVAVTPMHALRRLAITNVDYETDDSVTKFMTLFVSQSPALVELEFSCQGYMMDLWPCVEFWRNVQLLRCGLSIWTTDFVSVLYAGLCQLRDDDLARGVVRNHSIQLRLEGCDVENVVLVTELFGNVVF